jgi:hypothetical protein
MHERDQVVMAGSRNTEMPWSIRPSEIRPAGQQSKAQDVDFIESYLPKAREFVRVEWNGTKPATYVFKNSMNDPVRRDEKGPRVDDESTVRERSASTPPATTSNRPPSSPSLSSGASRDRLEQKLRRGRAILASLPAGDDRARLLHVAIMRRDETLLDGVLSSLGMKDSGPPR